MSKSCKAHFTHCHATEHLFEMKSPLQNTMKSRNLPASADREHFLIWHEFLIT